MSVDSREESREDAIVRAYLDGKKIAAIEEEFQVGRSTIYHILRRSGQLPARTQRRVEAATKDAALAGLYELIRHQDRELEDQAQRIEALVSELSRLRRRLHAAGLDDGAARRSKTNGREAASKRRSAG